MVLGVVVSAVVLVAALVALVVNVGRLRMDALVSRDVAALFAGAGEGVEADEREARIARLPAPVARYLRRVLGSSPRPAATACLRHGGTFRTAPGAKWLAIEGEEYFTATPPGFVWHAEVRAAPFVWIAARDRFLGGRGNMLVKLMSTFTLADASGPGLDEGALMRWLAEVPWFPDAFLSDAVTWEAVDERSARATARAGEVAAGGTFRFTDDGLIESFRTEGRPRDVGGAQVPTPWSGRYREWRETSGGLVPFSAEVTWHLEAGDFSYARFEVTDLEFGRAERYE